MYIWVYLVLYGGVWLQLLLMDKGGMLQRCCNWSGSGGVALGWLRVCSHVLAFEPGVVVTGWCVDALHLIFIAV